MDWALRFGFKKGVVLIDASLVCLGSVPNFTTKIWQHFALFSWRKSDNAFPQVRHSTQNAILTKLSLWEHDNGGAPFSRQKFNRVSCLVRYSALARFHSCVYGACQHACVRTSSSPSMHQAYWCVLHTLGNWCHLGDMDQDNHFAMIVHTI